MAKASMGQRKTEGRVMHEFKHGELKSGPGGKGGKVKSRKQAIAIALHEAGASNRDKAAKQKKNLATSKRKEARGETGQQEREGKSRVGASKKRESSRAMGGKNAKTPARRATAAKKTGSKRKPAGRSAKRKVGSR